MKTGEKTWDREQLLARKGDSTEQQGVETDIQSLEIKELEKLLAAAKKREEEKKLNGATRERSKDDNELKHQKRKIEVVEPSFKKRQKIVFDLKKKDEQSSKGREGRRKDSRKERVNNNSIDKDEDANPENGSATKQSDSLKTNSKDIVDTSTDSSLYGMDEDELQQLKTIKSKYSSPPKTPKSKKDKLSPQDVLNTSISSPPAKTTPRYLPENYGFQYVNYQKDPKESYQREYKPRDRPVLAKLKGEFTSKPLASSMVKAPPVEVDLDRTPEQQLDITPVFGSLEDSLEWGIGGGEMGSQQPAVHGVINVAHQAVSADDEAEFDETCAEVVQGCREDSWGETSWEGERPPTPTLVQEMQEEECMEWESVDREEVLKETHRVRALLSEAMETEETEAEKKVDQNEEKAMLLVGKKALVVVDTNVFISSLGLISHLREEVDVKVVIPWMVVQELDSLKTSTSSDTAVRARAAVRWLHNCLQAKLTTIVTQTAEHSKRAAARFESKNADDRILACCLMLKEEGNKVTLLTNDMNLANKGMINQVECGDAENIISVLSGEEKLVVQQEDGPNERKICSELVMQAENTARDLLEVVLKKEFLLAYGEKLWEKMVSIKPKPSRPHWSLANLFTLFSKHHIAVFGLAFPRNGHQLKQRLQMVKEKLRNRMWKVKEVKIVLAEISGLFEVIKERDNFEGIVDICTDKLSDISSQLENYETIAAGQGKKKILDQSVDNGHQSVQQLFQNVWEIIACFTRGFATAMSVVNSLPKFEPDIQFQSVADATRNLPTFFSTVSVLQEAMLGVVTNSGSEPKLIKFHNLLTQFRANLELDQSYWPAFEQAVTTTHLEIFLTNEQNQEVVMGGLDQISEFRQILIKCISGGGEDVLM